MENKRIVMGSDHAGLQLKLKVKAHLEARGFEVMDVGTHTPESCNYTVYADALCKALTAGEADLGILVCGTGIGMSIAANKHKGIRAACCENTFSARMTRMHNDANVLCWISSWIPPSRAAAIRRGWMTSTPWTKASDLTPRFFPIPYRKGDRI